MALNHFLFTHFKRLAQRNIVMFKPRGSKLCVALGGRGVILRAPLDGRHRSPVRDVYLINCKI